MSDAQESVSIQWRCPNIAAHLRSPAEAGGCECHPYLPTPCPDCYSIEVRSRRLPEYVPPVAWHPIA